MARRVFVHIGVPKSGTTYLQTAMWHNRPALEAAGFRYPGARRMDHYHAAQAMRRTRADADRGAWDRLVEPLRSWEGDGLVSHEFFSMVRPAQAELAVRSLAPAQVHVVLTARDYVRQIPAVWQEALKMGSTLTFADFLAKARSGELDKAWSWDSQDLVEVLGRWSGAVPPECIHVVTLPPPGAARTVLWERWCAVLGLDGSGFDLDVSFGNESLGVAQAALLRQVALRLSADFDEAPVRHRWLRQYFGHEVLAPQPGERFGVPPQEAADLRERSAAAAAAIAAAGYAVSGDLADLVPSPDQPLRPSPDDVDDTTMLEVAAVALERMIRDVKELTESRDEWRDRAQRRGRGPRRRLGRAVRR